MAVDITPGDGTQNIVSLADLDTDNEPQSNPPSDEVQNDGDNTGGEDTTDGGQEPQEGDGQEKEGEEQEEQGSEEPADVTPEAFFAEVNKLHGTEFQVEYPEGVDPLSPEGVHIRDKAIMDKAQKDFEEYLKQKDPRGYEYLLHRDNGGSDEDFFKKPTITLPEFETFQNSVDLQKQVLTRDLLNRGLEADYANYLVEKAITDGKLFEQAEKAYKAEEKAVKDGLAAAEKANADRIAAETKALSDMDTAINDIIKNGKTANIVIPDAKRAEFAEYVRQNMFFDGKQFFIMKPISTENAADAIQAEYFGFVKGDLKELVERKAKTAVANKFRLGSSGKKTPNSNIGDTNRTGTVPLGDI